MSNSIIKYSRDILDYCDRNSRMLIQLNFSYKNAPNSVPFINQTFQMILTIAIALLAIAEMAAINTTYEVEAERAVPNAAILEPNDSSPVLYEENILTEDKQAIELPDWLITFNNYMEFQNDSEYQIDNFVENLTDDEVRDLFATLYLMENDEN